MRKPNIDETNVRMSDVLCDFCRREWAEDLPMIEGHQGACICGNCLKAAFADLVHNKADTAPAEGFTCPMCLESSEDRAALNRGDEPGWRSPMYPESVVCRRCVKQSAVVLERSEEFDWSRPTPPS